MEEKENENEDMLDSITAFFTDSNKSRRQVLKKLKDLELIKVGGKIKLLGYILVKSLWYLFFQYRRTRKKLPKSQ